MAIKIKYYSVDESTVSEWNGYKHVKQAKFTLIQSGQVVCEMVPGSIMENITRKRFAEMAERFNTDPLKL